MKIGSNDAFFVIFLWKKGCTHQKWCNFVKFLFSHFIDLVGQRFVLRLKIRSSSSTVNVMKRPYHQTIFFYFNMYTMHRIVAITLESNSTNKTNKTNKITKRNPFYFVVPSFHTNVECRIESILTKIFFNLFGGDEPKIFILSDQFASS